MRSKDSIKKSICLLLLVMYGANKQRLIFITFFLENLVHSASEQITHDVLCLPAPCECAPSLISGIL